MSIELKPCPFCGAKAEFVDNGYWCVVICSKCDATSKSVMHSTDYAAKVKAAELWNRRVCGMSA